MTTVLTGLYSILIAASLFNPVVGTLTLLHLVFFRPAERMGFPYPITFALLVVCMLALMLHRKPFGGNMFTGRRYDLLLVMLMELYLLFNLVLFDRWSMFYIYESYLFPALMVFFMISEFTVTTKQIKLVYLVLLVSVLIICVDSLYVHFSVDASSSMWFRYHDDEGRLINVGTWNNSNKLGYLANIGVASCMIMVIAAKRVLGRLFWASPIVVFVSVLALTGSRAALLQLGVTTGFLFMNSRKKVLVFVLLIPLLAVGGIYWDKLSPERKYAEGSKETRIDLIYYAKDVFKEHPILGIGFKQFRDYNPYHQVPHNIYAQVFVELGLVGAIIFFIMLGMILQGGLRVIRSSRDREEEAEIYGLSRGTMAFVLGSLTYFVFGNELMDFIFLTNMGLLVVVRRMYELERPEMMRGPKNLATYSALVLEES